MTGISFIIPTSGTNDDNLNKIINSIEIQNIPEYEIILIGGFITSIDRKNTLHIPFNESITKTAWTSRKKNTGILASKYDILVIMHDYMVLDPNWYIEFEKFGFDWDICVHKNLAINPSDTSKYVRGNGWRAGPIPGYPEIPWAMQIPYDIDIFIPYMAIQGSYWCCKKDVMLDELIDESFLKGDTEDIEWSSRVVPCFLGNPGPHDYKVVANPNCVTRNIKIKPPYPGNPDFDQIERSLDPLWNEIRSGIRRPGVYLYDNTTHKVKKY